MRIKQRQPYWLLLFLFSCVGYAEERLLVKTQELLRIKHIERCGDFFSQAQQEFCVSTTGKLSSQQLKIRVGEKLLATREIKHDGDLLRITLANNKYQSGPLWLEQGEQKSNEVWLSMKGSHVIAANKSEVAKNGDGLITYVDLISVIIEENADGLQTARELAKKYDAKIVGAIPPLNTYQLRLPVRNLIERDALVLRIGTEIGVDAVIIEESGAEKEIESEILRNNPAHADSLDKGEWASNRFLDAVDFYLRRIPAKTQLIKTAPIKIGVIERDVDFDSPDFADYVGDCRRDKKRICLYARDAEKPESHGSTVAGIFAATWNNGGNSGFLRGLDKAGPGFDVIVDRNSDAGITANIAASVNLVEDGVRVLNWSWGIHRVGAKNVDGKDIDSLVRSGLAMSGYEELLEEFFLWLRLKHPDVIVINSAGNGASFSGLDEYRLPSSFVTEQLLVVGGHELSNKKDARVTDADYAVKRGASNIDKRVDITAAACVHSSVLVINSEGEKHCGTSYATPLVAGLVAAMLSINPTLEPEQIRILLRRSAMTIGEEADFEPTDADDLTSPILPSERNNELNHPDIGRSARLDMHKALDLTVQSLKRVR
ncbi:S8/S53 family peptidase [Cellvibrio mixtus]|uniref:S8/S53 family peptidase n=1 Tax=Cellvibrio mixtus TaxID=39650 RepID=UPI000693D2D7|nr:S8/S53 family peptidase [Cellvibrio mixtus]